MEQLLPDFLTLNHSSLRHWLNSSSPTRNSTSLFSRLLQLSGNPITLMLPLTTSTLPSPTSIVSSLMDQRISLQVLISPSAQLHLSEVFTSYLMESPTLVFPQLQAFKSISQIKTLPLPIRFTWIQFPLSWLDLNPPQREPCHSSSWMLSPMQLVDHSKDFLLHSELNSIINFYLFVSVYTFVSHNIKHAIISPKIKKFKVSFHSLNQKFWIPIYPTNTS